MDNLKAIRIKRADGTLTNLIPIGASSENINCIYKDEDTTLDKVVEVVEEDDKRLDKAEAELHELRNANKTYRRNNPEAVKQMLKVARSYYNARLTEKGGDPIFKYGYDGCLSKSYKGTNIIDCSTFIGLVLRGITIQESPYAKFIVNPDYIDDNVPEEDDAEDDDEEQEDESGESGDSDSEDINDYDPLTIQENKKKYNWAVNLGLYTNKLLPSRNETPVRTASQIGQWMYESGFEIELLDKDAVDKYGKKQRFKNVQPGDIIFWAKNYGTDENPDWKHPDRFRHISHVAVCTSVTEAPDEAAFKDYSTKHVMLEVTSKKNVVLNRSLEKVNPDQVVMVCRPDLSMNEKKGGSTYTTYGITNLNDFFTPGTYYVTGGVTGGLPDGVAVGTYHTLIIENSTTSQGIVRGIVQKLYNTSKNITYYRTQYCYSHLPVADKWTPWRKMIDDNIFNNTLNGCKFYVENGTVVVEVEV